MAKQIRAAAIGSTGKGDFGHGLDMAFKDLEGVEFVAVADDNAAGLQAAGKRTGVRNLYADYRELLAKEKPDVVSIGPRWLGERVAMVTAAARAGCHIYCEKPFAADLADADAMLAACDKAGVRIAVAHQFRAMPPVRLAQQQLKEGKFGKLLHVHARPKDDQRGGGEELLVHGTHLFDLMIAFGGVPRWVSGHVAVGARDAVRADRRRPSEPIGVVAGDSVASLYGLDNGVRGSFESRADLFRPDRLPYGVLLECEQACLLIRSPGDVFIYPALTVIPEEPKLTWEKLWVQDWHFTAEHKLRPLKDWIHRGNQILVKDLLEARVRKRPPLASGAEARLALEMIQGVYASHFAQGARLPIPLRERKHPLGTL